ncbi:MAG: hypothetical protein R2822_13475 [Spirosomataceae bacterium]
MFRSLYGNSINGIRWAFEAGISRPHEMQALQAIIQPTIGILPMRVLLHDEGFRKPKTKTTEASSFYPMPKTH